MNTTENTTPQFPNNWQIRDYDPNDHMMQLKGRDYLNVQNRLLWFVRDQRDFIVRGLAQMPYVIRSEIVELDTERGYAHFRTYVRDVLGNEATMYGSEQAKDFADYAEKASTKSLGRALLALGYGTAAAPEMDEGERVVDTPVERRQPQRSGITPARLAQIHASRPPQSLSDAMKTARDALDNLSKPASQNATTRAPQAQQTALTREPAQSSPRNPAPAPTPDPRQGEPQASEQQLATIHTLCNKLGKITPTEPLTNAQARTLISQLSNEYQQARKAVAK